MKNTLPKMMLMTVVAFLTFAISANAALLEGISGFDVIGDGATFAWSDDLVDSQAAFTSDPVDQDVVVGASSLGDSRGWTAGHDLGLDFGTDYATKTFIQVFMLQGSYSTTDIVANYYWSSDKELDAGDTAAPDFNLYNYTNFSSSSNGRWELQYENLAGVTPAQRYLIGDYVSGNGGNFGYEVAFVAIPEPATLSLLLISLVSLFAFRRR